MEKAGLAAGGLLLATCALGSLYGQTAPPAASGEAQKAAPLAFEVVSVKPAPPGTLVVAPLFMRDKGARIIGLQRMTAPVSMLIGYGYNMRKSEALDAFRKQPEWVSSRIYSVTFRAESDTTRMQVREMMRTMLAERFGRETHEFTREGTVNKLVMSKPGVLGPNLKLHPEGAPCATQESASLGQALDPTNPTLGHCGFTYYNLPGMVSHVGITDTTIADAAGALSSLGSNGLEARPLVDATGLTGKYDLTLEYRPHPGSPLMGADEDDGGVPTLIEAMKQQLGMRVETGTGPVRMVLIDHLAEPTPD